MPYPTYGSPPDAADCTDLGTLPLTTNTPHDAPDGLAGKPTPDSARIREAVHLMQRKGGAHTAQIKMRAGFATIEVGPDGWRVTTPQLTTTKRKEVEA